MPEPKRSGEQNNTLEGLAGTIDDWASADAARDVKQKIEQGIYDILYGFFRDRKIRDTAARYLVERGIGVLPEQQVYSYLTSLTPDGIQPHGAKCNPANNTAYFMRAHQLERQKFDSMYLQTIEDITVPKTRQKD
ncbi:MAG TPA: hypothetical protein VFF28_02890 [Candidatus Nanoarchaeia archaeon]|nr:hypothetical protein [Candidatus Nanoarchaeia archaeon]